MRTTLNLDDELMRAIKARAAETGRTMTELVDEALRRLLAVERAAREQPRKLSWTTVRGRVRPGVDVNDREALHDLMDGLR